MKIIKLTVLLLLGFSSLAQIPDMSSAEYIRRKVEDLNAGQEVWIGEAKINCVQTLPRFYQNRNFDPVWTKRAKTELLDVLKDATSQGLNPVDYHFQAINRISDKKGSDIEQAEKDLLFTDAFLLYSSHFLNGKVNPETVDSEWKAIRREGNSVEIFEKAMESGNVKEVLMSLEPDHPGYDGLKDALRKYKIIQSEGGWKTVPEGETLKPGMTDSIRVQLIIERLSATSDLSEKPENPYLFSDQLSEAVKTFQLRHGLDVDGNVGKATVAELNVLVEERINRIRINMERYRWISQELGDHFVLVNIADFRMFVFRENQLMFTERVIVGKPFRKTPVFSSKMTYFVLNPTWTVPPTILYQDLIPEARKNPNSLTAKNIRVIQGQGSSAKILDPNTIDWSKYTKGGFPYTLRQDPGPSNALGAVKFMFPNGYNIYIHDTPSRELFSRPDRAFSSGCIRLNKPMAFVDYLISDDPQWDEAKIREVLKTGKERSVMLKNPLDVHILYLTSWVEDERVQFRKDLYDRDAPVLKALNDKPPSL